MKVSVTPILFSLIGRFGTTGVSLMMKVQTLKVNRISIKEIFKIYVQQLLTVLSFCPFSAVNVASAICMSLNADRGAVLKLYLEFLRHYIMTPEHQFYTVETNHHQ